MSVLPVPISSHHRVEDMKDGRILQKYALNEWRTAIASEYKLQELCEYEEHKGTSHYENWDSA